MAAASVPAELTPLVAAVPGQETMEGSGNKPEWMKEPPLIDWNHFLHKATKPPLLYDPPQLEGLRSPSCCCLRPLNCVDWYTQNSGCCAFPVVPCCCASAVRWGCHSDAETVRVRNPDWWLAKMLSFPNKNCPERLRGVWWMDGNQINQELVMSFEDADWFDGHNAQKNSWENWARTPNCFGVVNMTLNYWRKGKMRISVSPNNKWLMMEHYLIYLPDPNEEVRDKHGHLVPRGPHDLIRVDYSPYLDPTGVYTYQYIARRVAYLDGRGKLVKTENWKMLEERLACCPQYCVCGDPAAAALKVADAQVIRWPKKQ